MITLIFKEIRQLKPILFLWVALLISAVVTTFSSGRIDEMTFSAWCLDCGYEPNVASVFVTCIMLMVVAYSLFPREHDDSTIDFLRALPVSRASIFVAKFLAAWIAISLLIVLFYIVHAVLLSANPESIGGRFYTQFWSTLLWRDCLFAFIVLSHGVFLSWFRTLGLILYFLYLVALLMAENFLGTSGDWSIFKLMSNDYNGSNLKVNSKALVIHSLVAIVLLYISYRLWNRTESSGTARQQTSRSFKFVQIISTSVAFLTIVMVMAYQIQLGTGQGESNELGVTGTEHFRFAFKSKDASRLEYLLENADTDLEKLSVMLGVDELPRIRVDLSAESEHAAGIAKWKKILIDLDAFDDERSNRRVLAHEATHVLQAIVSDRALSKNYNAVKFFIEGMAQYTSFEIVSENLRRNSNWTLASVAWKRQGLEFSDLIDAAGFARRYDAELHYSLGDIWVKAMVDVCGLASLGDFLRATGRESAVLGLRAEYFWRDTMQFVNCDLDSVNVRWREIMEDLYQDADKYLFPEFTHVIFDQSSSGFVKITATLEQTADTSVTPLVKKSVSDATVGDEASLPTNSSKKVAEPERFLIRIGNVTVSLASKFDPSYRGKIVSNEQGRLQVEFSVPKRAIPNNRFRYQLGYVYTEGARYLFDDWRNGSLSSQP